MPEEILHCVVCGESDDQGLVVCGHLICRNCEQEIISTKVDDPAYPELVRKLRQLWRQVANT